MSLILLLTTAPVYCNAQTYWTDENNYDTSWFDESAQEYSISTPEQLAGLAVLCNEIMPDDEGLFGNTYFRNKTIRLVSDIDLSGHIWLPCNLDLGYKGMFDGNNYTIDNMLIAPEKPEQNPTGLYGLFAQCARVKNLTIGPNSKIIIPNNFSNVDGVGAIAAVAYNVENCSNNASIDF